MIRRTKKHDHSPPGPMNDKTTKRTPQSDHVSNRKRFAKTKVRMHRKIIIIISAVSALYACIAVGFYSTFRQGMALDATLDNTHIPGGDQNVSEKSRPTHTFDSETKMEHTNELLQHVTNKANNDGRPKCFDDGKPCRYDDVGNYLEESAKFTMIHKPSDAIPAFRRIPADKGSDESYIVSRRKEGPADGSLTALVEYNPSLLPLTSDLDPKLLDYLTGRYHPGISDKEADRAKYLHVSRAANFHACVGGIRRSENATKEQSYLSLSLLDENLQPIPGASSAVRLYQALSSYCYNKKTSILEPFQDYQIIATRSTKGNDKKDQLFVMASDKRTFIFPIDIRRVPAAIDSDEGPDWDTKIKGTPISMTTSKPDLVGRSYGEGLQLRLMDDLFPGKLRCGKLLSWNVMDFQKNYHVFDMREPDSNGNAGAMSAYMEMRPHGWRVTRKVNFYTDKFHKFDEWQLVPGGEFIGQNGKRSESDIIDNRNRKGEVPYNWDGVGWKQTTREGRGTACCIDLELLAGGKKHSVKVGISHSVSAERGYVSQFYAFELKTGRSWVVAISGPFCFGGKKEHDLNAEDQIFSFPDKSRLNVTNALYDCPHVTFASGLVEYQADANYVVISYGISDCYSRSIVVSKDRIREFLTVNNSKLLTLDMGMESH